MNQSTAVSLKLDSSFSINDRTYASKAENAITVGTGTNRKLKTGRLTTSKLRTIYSLIMNIYTRVNSPEDFEQCFSDLQYIKVKMAYESGRDADVKNFILNTRLMDCIDAIKTYDQFVLYCRYAESLVAYFKFYGEENN